MKKVLSSTLAVTIGLLSPAFECSQAFAGMNTEGHAIDISAVPTGNFSLQPLSNLDISIPMTSIPSMLDGAHEVHLGASNLTPLLNPSQGVIKPVGAMTEKITKPIPSSNENFQPELPVQKSGENILPKTIGQKIAESFKAWEDPKTLTGAGLSRNFDNSRNKDSFLSPAFIASENNPIGDWKVGDKAIYSGSDYIYSVTIKKLYADGTALVSYGRLSDLVDQYLPVSILIKQVSHFGDWKVGDKAIYSGSDYVYSVTIKKLYADGTVLVSYGWLSGLVDRYLPASILVKQSSSKASGR